MTERRQVLIPDDVWREVRLDAARKLTNTSAVVTDVLRLHYNGTGGVLPVAVADALNATGSPRPTPTTPRTPPKRPSLNELLTTKAETPPEERDALPYPGLKGDDDEDLFGLGDLVEAAPRRIEMPDGPVIEIVRAEPGQTTVEYHPVIKEARASVALDGDTHSFGDGHDHGPQPVKDRLVLPSVVKGSEFHPAPKPARKGRGR